MVTFKLFPYCSFNNEIKLYYNSFTLKAHLKYDLIICNGNTYSGFFNTQSKLPK